MPRKNEASDARTVTLGTPLWQLRMPGWVPPIVFFVGSMGGLLAILWKALDTLATAGPWALSIAIPVLLLQLYLVASVVRLVENHPEGLMGGPRSTRRQIRRPPKPPSVS